MSEELSLTSNATEQGLAKVAGQAQNQLERLATQHSAFEVASAGRDLASVGHRIAQALDRVHISSREHVDAVHAAAVLAAQHSGGVTEADQDVADHLEKML